MTARATRAVVVDRTGGESAPVIVKAIPAWKAVLVRAGRTWLQSFLGFAALLVLGSLTVDTAHWQQWLEVSYLADLGRRVVVCGLVATFTALVSAAQNSLEILSGADSTRPGLRA